jgi:hypothetical protein
VVAGAREVAGSTVRLVSTSMDGRLTWRDILAKGTAGLAPGRLAPNDTQWALCRAGPAHAGAEVVRSLVMQGGPAVAT